MTDLRSIAVDRFGLGARADDAVGDDPRRWLLQQFDRFNVRPAAIAAETTSAQMLQTQIAYRAERAATRTPRNADQNMAAAPMADSMSAEAEPAQLPSRRALRAAYNTGADARLTAALTSDTPFVERLVHFWANHFAVSADKGTVTPLAASYEFEAIRPHVLGNFSQLLAAAVFHPAMLFYLDQQQSVGPNSELVSAVAERRRRRGNTRELGINENLAREILELHTLGVRTGYTQADVTEFARALTGWTVTGFTGGAAARRMGGEPGEVAFAQMLHEPGARTVLGTSYPATGARQSQAILADLVTSPLTARFLATKLARHFVADDPPPAVITRLEQAYLQSGGDLPSVYRALIEAPESWAEPGAKFRTPWDWTLAALRASGVETLPGREGGAVRLLQQLGQPVWRPGSPAGFSDKAQDWAGPGALIARVEFAQTVADRIGDRIDARVLAPVIMGDRLRPETLQAITRSEQPSTGLALLLSSPEFMRR